MFWAFQFIEYVYESKYPCGLWKMARVLFPLEIKLFLS